MRPSLDPKFPIDVERLIETRLLIQAGSGGGKSWTIRRLAEQTFHCVQQIIIDVEDEFQTLRQKFDYVLAGKNGDCPADVRCAAQLAHKLLELRVSTIVSISELKYHDRIQFVRLFLDALIESPRELWHPVLVVVDEVQVFAPQAREAESTKAVIDLMTRGRKRGLCGVIATQRISKVHKDAVAECNNKLIGLSSLDVDMKRASDELGFTTREQNHSLRKLNPGQFFSFGPALSKEVTLIQVGEVCTSHPKIGQRHAPPPPPTAKVRKALEKLADLPAQVEKEKQTTADLQKRIRELEDEIRDKLNGRVDQSQLIAAKNAGYDKAANESKQRERVARAEIDAAKKSLDKALDVIAKVYEASFDVDMRKLNGITTEPIYDTKKVFTKTTSKPVYDTEKRNVGTRGQSRSWAADGTPLGDTEIGKCERAILMALAQCGKRCGKNKIAILSEYSVKSSGFNNSLSKLRVSGYINGGGDEILITGEGLSALGEFDPLPTGQDLVRYWVGKVGKCEGAILSYLASVYPKRDYKGAIAQASGYSEQSSGFNNALSKLRTMGLIEGRGEIAATKDLMED